MPKLDFKIMSSPMDAHGHCHAYAHILIPLAERLVVRYGDREYDVTHEQLIFVPPNHFHHCLCPTDVIGINIPSHLIKQSDLDALGDQTVLPIEGFLIPLVELIKADVARTPESDSLRYLYYYLYDKIIETADIKSLRYIRNHYSEPITVAQLAQLESYNISYFTDWFKRRTGVSPSHYLRNVRIEKAKELLSNSHYRMLDIALQVGYQSNAAFARAFKESEGISPMDYRASQGK